MNALTEIQPQPPSNYSLGGIRIELAKMLKLVAPISMSAEAQAVFIQAAEDALQDIRVDEVQAVATEIKRSITRPAQIVPEIARLVAERRTARNRPTAIGGPALPPPPERKPGPPLDADEIAKMPRWMKEMGLRVGFLKRRDNGALVDSTRA